MAVLAIKVDLGALGPEWLPGPLPVVQPQNEATRHRGHLGPTDEATRRTLVDVHQANVLYGPRYLVRCHRIVSEAEIVALELLCERTAAGGFGMFAVHVAPQGDAIDDLLDWLSRSARRQGGADLVEKALELAGSGLVRLPGAIPHVLSYAAVPEAQRDEELRLTAAYAMATGSPPAAWRDQAERAAGHTLLIAKPDWSVLVLRDGAAYVSHDRSSETYAENLRMLVHSVHLDALLLALVQRVLIDRSGDGAVAIPLDQPEGLVELESGHYEFRRTYWRTALTRKRTAPPDLVLHAFQDELLTTADVVDVEERVSDGARLALSLRARQQQEIQVRQEKAQEDLNRIVQNGSVVIGSFALAFTAAPVIADPSWTAFWIALVCGTAAMLASFAVLSATGRRAGA